VSQSPNTDSAARSHAGPDAGSDLVSDAVSDAVPETGPSHDLERLVGEWLTVPDVAERLGVPLARVRRLIADRELLAARVGERHVQSVPAKFLDDEGPRPELRGTFTVLADGGMHDDEIITWLFTPDPTLPVEGAPIDALRAGHKTEIRRRAQELAF
jgi:excisionase family DNA binding protein